MDFLEIEDILTIHTDQVNLYGGRHGVRDMGLLESAAAQAQASFAGQLLHADIFDMAAAYLFHIVRNHPFIDGNKRTGLVAALVFLDLNGIKVDAPKGSLYDMTMSVATGRTDKKELAEFFRKLAH